MNFARTASLPSLRLFAFAAGALALAACTSGEAPSTANEGSGVGSQPVVAEEASEGSATAEIPAQGARIVTLSGGVTETVVALGRGDDIVAVDVSSVYPPEMTELPQVGYHRMLSAEGVIGLEPTHILGTVDDGPAPAVASLQALGVPYLQVAEVATVEDAHARTRAVAAALGREEEGEALITEVQAKIDAVGATLPPEGERPSIVGIYARGHGVLLASGTNSAMDTLITLSGGRNAVTGYEGFRPLTPEALVAAQPDAILIPARGLESLGGEEGVLRVTGMAETPAGQNRAFIVMDDSLLLAFGPRLGEAVEAVAEAFRGLSGE